MYPSLENSTTGIAITKGYTHATSLYASDSSVSTSAASTPSMMSLADGVGIAYDIVGHILEEVICNIIYFSIRKVRGNEITAHTS